MASSACENADSRRMSVKRPVSRQTECPSSPRTPLRQKVSPALVCPGAPRRQRPYQGTVFLAQASEDFTSETSLSWDNYWPLESFQFDKLDLFPEQLSLPDIPTALRDLPLLGKPRAPSCCAVLDQPSPLPKALVFTSKAGNEWQDTAKAGAHRKRPRTHTQRQLKFDSLPSLPPSKAFDFPRLIDYNLPSFSQTSRTST